MSELFEEYILQSDYTGISNEHNDDHSDKHYDYETPDDTWVTEFDPDFD